MSGGIYSALSGLRLRVAQLDQAAADIANAGTAGYKSERASTWTARCDDFQSALDRAADVVSGPTKIDFRPGTLVPTGRDLDLGIDGRGFFVVQTGAGPRYTRNGNFARGGDGTLIAPDGSPVLGESGPIKIGTGAISIDGDGMVRVGKQPVGRLQIVDFDDLSGLQREDAGRFVARNDEAAKPAKGVVRSGVLEQSNVSVMERIADLTELTRNFEALNRGVNVLFNELDGRAITELGRH